MTDVTSIKRCAECLRTGQRSTVQQTSRVKLAVGSYTVTVECDGEELRGGGVNVTTRTFQCSRGHYWTEVDRAPLASGGAPEGAAND